MNGRKYGVMIALILIVVGLLVAGVALASVGFDFSGLSTASYVTNSYDVKESFLNIMISGDTEDIVFVPSEDSACRIVCREREDEPHHVEVKGDTLNIENVSKANWHFFDFSFLTEGPSITVYLPEAAYAALEVKADTGDVNIPGNFSFDSVYIHLSTGDIDFQANVAGALSVKTSTGDISLVGLTADALKLSTSTGGIHVTDVQCVGNMDIQVSTGRTVLENVTCGSLLSTGSTGSLTLTNVIASGSFDLRRSTGSISFVSCDAAEITAKTDTGSIKGTLLAEKVFHAHSDTGRVEVPNTTTGGLCELLTDTGSIEIHILPLSKDSAP